MRDISIDVAGMPIVRHAPHTIKSRIALTACDIDASIMAALEW
jgi:hypothetical protein